MPYQSEDLGLKLCDGDFVAVLTDIAFFVTMVITVFVAAIVVDYNYDNRWWWC